MPTKQSGIALRPRCASERDPPSRAATHAASHATGTHRYHTSPRRQGIGMTLGCKAILPPLRQTHDVIN